MAWQFGEFHCLCMNWKMRNRGWFRGGRHKIRGNLTVWSHVMCRRTFKILVLLKHWDHHQGLQPFKCREILTPPILSIYSNKPGPNEWRAFGLLLPTGSFHHSCLYPSGLSLKMHRKSFIPRAAFLRSSFPEFAGPLDEAVEGNNMMFLREFCGKVLRIQVEKADGYD